MFTVQTKTKYAKAVGSVGDYKSYNHFAFVYNKIKGVISIYVNGNLAASSKMSRFLTKSDRARDLGKQTMSFYGQHEFSHTALLGCNINQLKMWRYPLMKHSLKIVANTGNYSLNFLRSTSLGVAEHFCCDI